MGNASCHSVQNFFRLFSKKSKSEITKLQFYFFFYMVVLALVNTVNKSFLASQGLCSMELVLYECENRSVTLRDEH